MKFIFKKIPVTITERKMDDYIQKIQLLLTDIRGYLYITKLRENPYPINKVRLIKNHRIRKKIRKKIK